MSASRLHAEHDREWIAGDHASSQAPSRKAHFDIAQIYNGVRRHTRATAAVMTPTSRVRSATSKA